MRDEPEDGAKAQPLKRQSLERARRKQSTSRLDVLTGMTFSNLVMFAIIVATAQTLHAHGKTTIQSAAQAAAGCWPSPCSPAPARAAWPGSPANSRGPRGPPAKPLFSTALLRWAQSAARR
jgi:hypothetical protein